MSDELKPCSFCGYESPHQVGQGNWLYLACNSCGAGGPVTTQMRDPEEYWNTRPIENALRADLAAKDAEIERLKEYASRLSDIRAKVNREIDSLIVIDALRAELAAARAEVERLRMELIAAHDHEMHVIEILGGRR